MRKLFFPWNLMTKCKEHFFIRIYIFLRINNYHKSYAGILLATMNIIYQVSFISEYSSITMGNMNQARTWKNRILNEWRVKIKYAQLAFWII